jgi:hypothetical protein
MRLFIERRNKMKNKTLRSKCPHLADWKFKSCDAPEIPYTPSQFQLQEYCSNISHIKCPLYLDAAESMAFTGARRESNKMKVR